MSRRTEVVRLLPRFECRALDEIMQAFDRRRKAITQWGKIVAEAGPPNEPDWISLRLETRGNADPRIDIADDLTFQFYVIQREGHFGGRTLLKIDGGCLTSQPDRVVRAFEKSIQQLPRHNASVMSHVDRTRFREIWSDVSTLSRD